MKIPDGGISNLFSWFLKTFFTDDGLKTVVSGMSIDNVNVNSSDGADAFIKEAAIENDTDDDFREVDITGTEKVEVENHSEVPIAVVMGAADAAAAATKYAAGDFKTIVQSLKNDSEAWTPEIGWAALNGREFLTQGETKMFLRTISTSVNADAVIARTTIPA